jgi:large subunit ribosomal protein L1
MFLRAEAKDYSSRNIILSNTILRSNTMATSRPCLAQLSRLCLSSPPPTTSYISIRSLSSTVPLSRAFVEQIRSKKEKTAAAPISKYKKKDGAQAKKKKQRVTYLQYDLRDMEKFSLCDAMRYVSSSRHHSI